MFWLDWVVHSSPIFMYAIDFWLLLQHLQVYSSSIQYELVLYEQITTLLFILVFIEFVSSSNSILQFREFRNFWKFMMFNVFGFKYWKVCGWNFNFVKIKTNVKFVANLLSNIYTDKIYRIYLKQHNQKLMHIY